MHFLVRLSGEICTKARRTRLRFTQRLARNVLRALEAKPGTHRVEREWSRLVVETDDETAGERIVQVAGVQSVSRIEVREWSEIEDLIETAREFFEPSVRNRKFAVRARRTGDRLGMPFTSLEVERRLGTALLPGASGVDLERPEATASLDIHQGHVHLFTEAMPGPGGLPLGVEGRALALVSGGFDSAVASWLLLKRGVTLDYLFFNLGGTAHLVGTLEVMKVIADSWSWGVRSRLHAVDLRPVVENLQDRVDPRYWQVVLKRLMLRAADRLAERIRCPALVTGEAVGQVSSQTLQNLAVLSEASSRTILRPLVGFNKEEILAIARRIGTYTASAAVDEYCALLPKHPVTHASAAAVERCEAQLDPALLDRALEESAVFNLREIEPSSIARPELEATEISPDDKLIDLRPRADFDRWHPEPALWLEFREAVRTTGALPRDQRYVLYCEIGVKSAHLAELMRDAGFDARHVPGGISTLRRWLGDERGSREAANAVAD